MVLKENQEDIQHVRGSPKKRHTQMAQKDLGRPEVKITKDQSEKLPDSGWFYHQASGSGVDVAVPMVPFMVGWF